MGDADRSPTAGRPRRERNPEETRRRILDAAENEFATKGYDGARLRDVAFGAGVHHALLHHYFGDKEGLFRAVLTRAIGNLSTRAYQLLRSSPDVRALVTRYVDVVVDYYSEHGNLVQILHFAQLDPGSPAYAMCEEIAQSMLMPLVEATVRTVERAQQQGAIRTDVDARRLVTLAMGAAGYLFHEDAFFSMLLGEDVRSAEALEAHKRATVKLLLQGLLSRDS